MAGRRSVTIDPATRAAIERAAVEEGLDPAWALAIAYRENERFDPRARASKTIRGLYQMRGDHRTNYGIGDSDDPYTQAKGWGRFFKDVKKEMAGGLGRDPSDAEGYLGHHFGGRRAARMMKMDPGTPVDQVFTPREMAENQHFAKAGTVGRLNSTILADLDRRKSLFGGAAPSEQALDLSAFAQPADDDVTSNVTSDVTSTLRDTSRQSAGLDLSAFSSPDEDQSPAPSVPVASSALDLSQFGDPAA